MKTVTFLNHVLEEYRRARTIFPQFNSGHEGYSIILEELDELWAEIKDSPDSRNINKQMVLECIQIAAMAMAFVMDLQPAKGSFKLD